MCVTDCVYMLDVCVPHSFFVFSDQSSGADFPFL